MRLLLKYEKLLRQAQDERLEALHNLWIETQTHSKQPTKGTA